MQNPEIRSSTVFVLLAPTYLVTRYLPTYLPYLLTHLTPSTWYQLTTSLPLPRHSSTLNHQLTT